MKQKIASKIRKVDISALIFCSYSLFCLNAQSTNDYASSEDVYWERDNDSQQLISQHAPVWEMWGWTWPHSVFLRYSWVQCQGGVGMWGQISSGTFNVLRTNFYCTDSHNYCSDHFCNEQGCDEAKYQSMSLQSQIKLAQPLQIFGRVKHCICLPVQ